MANTDLYTRAVATVLGIPFQQVTTALRNDAKMLCFATMYGLKHPGVDLEPYNENKVFEEVCGLLRMAWREDIVMHTVRLETETGHFVTAGRIPPFQTLPTIIMWGERFFHLYEAGANGYPHRYRERFAVALVEESDVDPLPTKEPKSD